MLAHWVLNMLVFTLMYAVHVERVEPGRRLRRLPVARPRRVLRHRRLREAIWFQHHTIGTRLRAVPAAAASSGWSAALVGVPVAAIAMRTRADVFAIVTITLLFVAQTLAFNLRSLTGGAQGLSHAGRAVLARDTFERPFYYVLLDAARGGDGCSTWAAAQQGRAVAGGRARPTRTRRAGSASTSRA